MSNRRAMVALLSVVVLLMLSCKAQLVRGSCMREYLTLSSVSGSPVPSTVLADRESALKSYSPPIDSGNVNDPQLRAILSAVLGGRQAAQKFADCLTGAGKLCRQRSPCRNGGRCLFSSTLDTHLCRCPRGFKGASCEIADASVCDANTCRNGGTCSGNSTSYICSCKPLFAGRHCEREWWSEAKQQHTDHNVLVLRDEIHKVREEAVKSERRLVATFNAFLSNLQAKTDAHINHTLWDLRMQVKDLKSQVMIMAQAPLPTAQSSSSTTLAREDIRLVGGGERSGRVEVQHNGVWGTICDDSWDVDDAHVICRMLGFQTALNAPTGSYFGAGSGQIVLDDVMCSGSESSIGLCHHRGWGVHNCAHTEDAGVVCE